MSVPNISLRILATSSVPRGFVIVCTVMRYPHVWETITARESETCGYPRRDASRCMLYLCQCITTCLRAEGSSCGHVRHLPSFVPGAYIQASACRPPTTDRRQPALCLSFPSIDKERSRGRQKDFACATATLCHEPRAQLNLLSLARYGTASKICLRHTATRSQTSAFGQLVRVFSLRWRGGRTFSVLDYEQCALHSARCTRVLIAIGTSGSGMDEVHRGRPPAFVQYWGHWHDVVRAVVTVLLMIKIVHSVCCIWASPVSFPRNSEHRPDSMVLRYAAFMPRNVTFVHKRGCLPVGDALRLAPDFCSRQWNSFGMSLICQA